MKKNKWIRQVAMCIIATVLVTSCIAPQEELYEVSQEEIDIRENIFILDNPYLEARPIPAFQPEPNDVMIEMGMGFFGFGVDLRGIIHPPGSNIYGRIRMNDTNDYLQATVEYMGLTDTYFMLKMFIDYEEVPFQVLGEENYVTEFVFPMPPSYVLEIPFSLDMDFADVNQTHRLTAAIFVDPYLQLIDINSELFEAWSNGMSLNFDLIFGSGSDICLTTVPVFPTISRKENRYFPVFTVNQNLEGFEREGWHMDRPYIIQIDRGEEIHLAFHASLQGAIDYVLRDYLIIFMLDWEQISVNGQPYLHVEIDNYFEFGNIAEHGIVTLDAIDEPGSYLLTAIMIRHPTYPISLENSFPHEISNRILIEVLE